MLYSISINILSYSNILVLCKKRAEVEQEGDEKLYKETSMNTPLLMAELEVGGTLKSYADYKET